MTNQVTWFDLLVPFDSHIRGTPLLSLLVQLNPYVLSSVAFRPLVLSVLLVAVAAYQIREEEAVAFRFVMAFPFPYPFPFPCSYPSAYQILVEVAVPCFQIAAAVAVAGAYHIEVGPVVRIP